MAYNIDYLNKFDWNEIQSYYDDGKVWKDLIIKFKLTNTLLSFAVSNGVFKSRNKSESVKLLFKKYPRKHAEKTKNRISEIRKKYLSENPDQVPYLLNHSSKESYPEKYFTILFKKENIHVEKSFRIGLYELDFCIPDKKIDIEIDGNQHYFDSKIIESDKRRTEYLKLDGWDVIRINWSEYQKMNFYEKSDYISKLKNYIYELVDNKPSILYKSKIKYKKIGKCSYCGSECSYNKERCNKCYHIENRRVERPSYETLIEELAKFNYSALGRKYGVSDNSIRKWIKNYEKSCQTNDL